MISPIHEIDVFLKGVKYSYRAKQGTNLLDWLHLHGFSTSNRILYVNGVRGVLKKYLEEYTSIIIRKNKITRGPRKS